MKSIYKNRMKSGIQKVDITQESVILCLCPSYMAIRVLFY